MENELEMRMSEIEEIQNGVNEIKETLKDSKSRLDILEKFFRIIGNDSMSDDSWIMAIKGLNKIEDKLK